jgi:selenocysteine lyase/cysteine desulfurase
MDDSAEELTMVVDRRQFLTVAGAAAATTTLSAFGSKPRALASPMDPASLREHYPRALQQVYLDCAAHCPLSTHARRGMDKYMDFHMYGPGDGRQDYVNEAMSSVKAQFAGWIHAKPEEVAFVQSTKAGEWAVFNGLDIHNTGGNVVTNDLHYAGSVHSYMGHKKAGMDVRIIKAKDWIIDLEDMDAAIDKDTKFVAITLLSNVNGQIEDAKAITEMAHAKGAYVYADIIQAVGAIPVDVEALGLDFAACSNYKWLQGVRGSGYLYVREDLQGRVVKDMLYPGYVRFNYPPWVDPANANLDEFPYDAPKDASRYEPGNTSREGYCAQYEAFKVLDEVGIDNIVAHTLPLVERLRNEMPEGKYRCITPAGTRGPVIVFIPADYEGTKAKLVNANIQVTMTGNRLRISPSFYNNDEDIDTLLDALV